MTDLSQEVRILNTTAELIENSVNKLICVFSTNESGVISTVSPKDIIEKKYFFILLLEIISPVNVELIPNKKPSDNLLTLIKQICENPNLSKETNNIQNLYSCSEIFAKWLDQKFNYEIYSANLGKNLKLSISRKNILYLVGNRCKHTLVRSNVIIDKLAKIYKDSGVEPEKGTETLILEDIDNWFFDDFCGYHFTKLCELYSDLYYAIIEYVRPEFNKRYIKKGEFSYYYEMPSSLIHYNQEVEFYQLFNRLRNVHLPRIRTSDMLTGLY